MRANRKFLKDEKAQVGIGTMIVFIAAILVAAVAAGVLIDVGGKLQSRSARTGNEATEQVSGNLRFVSIVGDVTSGQIDTLKVYLSVAPGAPNMDMSELLVQFSTPTLHFTYCHDPNADCNSTQTFNASAIRDEDSSFDDANGAYVANAGDLILVTVPLTNKELDPRTSVTLVLVPENGQKVQTGFTTPPSYGSDASIVLK